MHCPELWWDRAGMFTSSQIQDLPAGPHRSLRITEAAVEGDSGAQMLPKPLEAGLALISGLLVDLPRRSDGDLGLLFFR